MASRKTGRSSCVIRHTVLSLTIGVAVDEQVAKRHHARQVGNSRGERRAGFGQAAERLADDLEMPLHCCAKHLVRQVLVLGNACREPKDCVGALPRIPKEASRVTLHAGFA